MLSIDRATKVSLLAGLVLILAAGALTAAEFTADLVVTRGGNEMSGRLYVSDHVYRLDFVAGEREFFITVNTLTDTATILDASKKEYFHVPAASPPIISSDPFQAVRSAAKLNMRQFLGSDTLQGWACDRFRIRNKNKLIFTEWVARDLDFPILIVDHQDRDTAFAALRNIEITNIMPEIFEIPEAYSLRRPDPPKQEETGTVKAGDEIRLPVDPNQYAEVTLINVLDTTAQAVVMLLKDGDELTDGVVGSIESRTFTLNTMGEQIRKIWDARADEVLIRVIQGEVAVDVLQP